MMKNNISEAIIVSMNLIGFSVTFEVFSLWLELNFFIYTAGYLMGYWFSIWLQGKEQ